MRLLHTEPLQNVLARMREDALHTYYASNAHVLLDKSASTPVTTHALAGELYASKSGWILLDVPNALVRGAFDALNEHGVELPLKENGQLVSHISVMRPEEIKEIGGIDKVTERGHHFNYTLGPVQSVTPASWDGVSKVWFIQVKSIDLQNLRKSYGLSALPNKGKFAFHITIAVKKTKVLQENEISKSSSIIMPILRAGGLAADVAGLKAITGEKEQAEDPAATILSDDSHLNAIRSMPKGVPVKKKRRVPPVIKSLIKESSDETEEEVQHQDSSAQEQEVRGLPETYEKEACDAIFMYYENLHTAANTARTVTKRASVLTGIKDNVSEKYDDLKYKYGPTMAKVIVGSGLAGLPIPVPGSSLLTAAPALGAAELAHSYQGDYGDTERKKQQHRKEFKKNLGKMLLTSGVATAAGASLLPSTNTLLPAQVTKFPGDTKPHVIRGGIYPGAKSSIIEDTGGGYTYLGPEHGIDSNGQLTNWNRLHGYIKDPASLQQELHKTQRTENPLQVLELQGHGSFSGQDLGTTSHDPNKQLGPKTVDQVASALNSITRTPDSKMIGYGCNTGICKPEFAWEQQLADKSNMDVLGARGYVSSAPGTGLTQDVHHSARGLYPPIEGGDFNQPNEDYSFTKYSPGKAPERVTTQTRDTQSKDTWGALPADRTHEFAYNLGRPAALAGAGIVPFLSDRKKARNTALLSTLLASPMALSEIATRLAESKANSEMGTAPNTLSAYLENQQKSIPYAALAALPLLSYGGAKLLGRWKK